MGESQAMDKFPLFEMVGNGTDGCDSQGKTQVLTSQELAVVHHPGGAVLLL